MSESFHVVCSYCNAVNRIPAARMVEQPKCGQCHKVLFGGHPVDLTASHFQKQVARSDIPLLVDFWAPWCGPCKTMAPAFEQAAVQLEPQVRLVKVNTEAEQALATQYSIRSIPTLALFKNGREVARLPGAMGSAEIVRWVQSHLQ